MKSHLLLKHNINALLRARGETQRDLAQWCLKTNDKRADSWLSHIFGPKGFETRYMPSAYLDLVAGFFGMQVYELFRPGAGSSEITNRRSGLERRKGPDRRIKTAVLAAKGVSQPILAALSEEELALIRKFRQLSEEGRANVLHLTAVARTLPFAPSTTKRRGRPKGTKKRGGGESRDSKRDDSGGSDGSGKV